MYTSSMEILTTVLLITASVAVSIFLTYKGVMGFRKTIRADKK
jgi:peroxiredoxin family protein